MAYDEIKYCPMILAMKKVILGSQSLSGPFHFSFFLVHWLEVLTEMLIFVLWVKHFFWCIRSLFGWFSFSFIEFSILFGGVYFLFCGFSISFGGFFFSFVGLLFHLRFWVFIVNGKISGSAAGRDASDNVGHLYWFKLINFSFIPQ